MKSELQTFKNALGSVNVAILEQSLVNLIHSFLALNLFVLGDVKKVFVTEQKEILQQFTEILSHTTTKSLKRSEELAKLFTSFIESS